MQQVLCTRLDEGSDVRCSICGQGFLVYWSRFSRAEQVECRWEIQEHLRSHHDASLSAGEGYGVHPGTAFNVPEWAGVPELSAAALVRQSKQVSADTLIWLDEG